MAVSVLRTGRSARKPFGNSYLEAIFSFGLKTQFIWDREGRSLELRDGFTRKSCPVLLYCGFIIIKMKTTDSQSLLFDYAKTGSEVAFRELLLRYIDMVYSVAVRRICNDADLAKDVVQNVFIDLARNARKLPPDVMLGGWLHRHTVFVASTVMRSQRRRQSRERKAAEMNAQPDHTQVNLDEISPVLDEAINELAEEDRTALLLRFFEQLDLRAVGEALGSSEEAARKRVTRALEKLYLLLQKRGVNLSASALGTALATNAVTTAPTSLALSVVGPALAGAAASAGSTAPLLQVASAAKLKFGLAGVVVVAGLQQRW